MTIKDRDQLQLQAQSCLQNASCDPKKLVLTHTGITVGVSLAISLIGLLIQQGVAQTGGLSGIESRNMLQTLESMLNTTYSIAMMFWPVGLVYTFMLVARSQHAEQRDLARGFFRWGPVLRLTLLKYLLFIGLAIPCAYISSMLTISFSDKLIEVMGPVAEALSDDPNADVMALVAEIPLGELLPALAPVLIVFAILYLTIAIFLGYRLRFASYAIVDESRVGALAAMRQSMAMTKGHVKDLFLLDLRFWRYYVLSFLITGLCFADMLPGVGDALPLSRSVTGILCYCIYAGLLLWLDCTFRPRMETTYATAYDVMK